MHQRGRRRLLVAGGALLVAPFVARAQRGQKVYRIGFLSPTAPGLRDQAFLNGMRGLGYVEGRNVHIEMRFAEGRPERLSGLAEELVGLKPDVLAVVV